MIQDQLREAWNASLEPEVVHTPYGSTTVISKRVLPPDELVIEDPEFITLPLHETVEFTGYTLSLTKSTDDRIVYERDK